MIGMKFYITLHIKVYLVVNVFCSFPIALCVCVCVCKFNKDDNYRQRLDCEYIIYTYIIYLYTFKSCFS